MHKNYLAERAVEMALALNKQRVDSQEAPHDIDSMLEDAGKILAFMEKGSYVPAS